MQEVTVGGKKLDLNKLSIEQLKAILTIVESEENNRKTEVAPEKPEPVREIVKEKLVYIRRKREINRDSPETFKKVKELVDKGVPFRHAFARVTGKATCGQDYNAWNSWLAHSKPHKKLDHLEMFEKASEDVKAGVPICTALIRQYGYATNQIEKFREYLKSKGIDNRLRTRAETLAMAKEARERGHMIRHKPHIPSKAVDNAMKYNALDEEGAKLMLGNTEDLVVTEFPDLAGIQSNDTKSILIDIVRNSIKMHCAITPKMEGEMLNINKIAGWNAFVSDFMIQSGRIAKYFGVPNKFKLSGSYIIYR